MDFFTFITDALRALRCKISFILFISIVCSSILTWVLCNTTLSEKSNQSDILNLITNAIAIFIGFYISALSIIVTSQGEFIETLKSKTSKRRIDSQPMSQFKELILTMATYILGYVLLLGLILLCRFSVEIKFDYQKEVIYAISTFVPTVIFITSLDIVSKFYHSIIDC